MTAPPADVCAPQEASGDSSVSSFRDPAGRLFASNGRIFRIVYPEGREILRTFLKSDVARRLLREGRLVRTRVLDPDADFDSPNHPVAVVLAGSAPGSIAIEHEKLAFPSYPYEWPPEMLHAAASLTLDLAEDLLEEGLGLKDATPYNVLFHGPTPVFVDLLSFEQREPGDATWLPYAQFIRTFLLPLLVNKHFALSLDQIFLTRRDGLEVEEVSRWLSVWQKLRPPFLSLVSIPAWLDALHKRDDTSIYEKRLLRNPEKARFILGVLFRRLRRVLRAAAPGGRSKSRWHDYMTAKTYGAEEFAVKEAFTAKALAALAPRTVLDAGCNTGHFSVIAARAGASVVALDYDSVVVGSLWHRTQSEKLDILPLVVNLARPTPATGWRNWECRSFLERARGRFDMVLMLALAHHLLVTERIPLEEILGLAAELTTDALLIEYIGPEDSMFRVLTRGRDHLHKDLTPESFENACRRHFRIVRSHHREGSHRRMYLLRKRAGDTKEVG